MLTPPVHRRAVVPAMLMLVAATAIWGFGFVATQHTLAHMHPLWSNVLRFVIAAPVAVLLFHRGVSLERGLVQVTGLAGVVLAGAFAFQTWGLSLTTVARSSLITSLYAVFTPLLAPVFRAPRPNLLHGVAAVVALAGTTLLCDVHALGLGAFNLGDLLTLACALLCAVHIHLVGRVAPGRDPMGINVVQTVACAVASLAFAAGSGVAPPTSVPTDAWMALVYLAVVSSVLAFGAQVKAQQVLTPSTAGTLMLMEAPWGVLGGIIVLGDSLSGMQAVGGLVMIAGCLLSVRADARA